jgi:predicted ATPase
MDRSFVDNIGYRRAFDSDVPDWLFDEARGAYDKVFILDRLPVTNWEDDDVRGEDEQTAQNVHDEIHDAYVELGYTPIEVPVMTVEKRANFIIERAEELPSI